MGQRHLPWSRDKMYMSLYVKLGVLALTQLSTTCAQGCYDYTALPNIVMGPLQVKSQQVPNPNVAAQPQILWSAPC